MIAATVPKLLVGHSLVPGTHYSVNAGQVTITLTGDVVRDNPDSARPSETSAPGRQRNTSTRHSLEATSRHAAAHARLCLSLCATLCNKRSARTPHVPHPLPSQPAATGLPAAALLPPASSAAATRFEQTKTPRSVGDILENCGLSNHSATRTPMTPGCWSSGDYMCNIMSFNLQYYVV